MIKNGSFGVPLLAFVINMLPQGIIQLNIWATTIPTFYTLLKQRKGRKIMKPSHCVDVWFSYQTSEGNISLNTVFSHTKAHYIFIPQLMTSLYFWPSLVVIWDEILAEDKAFSYSPEGGREDLWVCISAAFWHCRSAGLKGENVITVWLALW